MKNASIGSGLRIVHVVRSDAFAGVERYVCGTASALARRGHLVHVIGGDPKRMRSELDPEVAHSPARSTLDAGIALARSGRPDLVHAHMTAAEAAAVLTKVRHRAPIVSTRHFPGRRGRHPLMGAVGRMIGSHVAAEVATSGYVAERISEAAVVLHHGIPEQPAAPLEEPRVLMLQRLEREKSPEIAIHAWAASGLGSKGWYLDVAGSGSLERSVRQLAADLGVQSSVRFLGHVDNTDALLQATSIMVAPGSMESFGLAVVEAMAHGVPVVAASGGGHLETLGDFRFLFEPGDADAAGEHLARLADDSALRSEAGQQLRARQQSLFSVAAHVDRLESLYRSLLTGER